MREIIKHLFDQLLTRFDKDHKGVKVVVDEFGGFVGIIGAEAVLSVLAGWWKKSNLLAKARERTLVGITRGRSRSLF